MAWRLSLELTVRLDQVETDIGRELLALNQRWQDQPARWRDSEDGEHVRAWFNEVEAALDTLANLNRDVPVV